MRVLTRLRASVGLAIAQLRYDRTRTALAVLGVALAVVSTTLLLGLGIGVVAFGEERFAQSDQELWVTGGPVELAPGTVGGVDNSLTGSHELSDRISRHEDVKIAAPLAFQTVYVGRNRSELEPIAAVGVPFVKESRIGIDRGSTFSKSGTHYANGTYDGPMNHEVLIDQRTASLFDVGIGDTLYVGGTTSTAREHEFEIVGFTSTFSQFLGTSTVTLQLSELQEVTGTTGTDEATYVAVNLEDGADPDQVAGELEREYPNYDVRTNEEQLQSLLQERLVVLAAGVSLAGLAVVVGFAITLNLLLSFVAQQRRQFAALQALGCSRWTLGGTIVAQALVVGLVGVVVGLGLSVPLAIGLEWVAETLVGFGDVIQLSGTAVLVGAWIGGVTSLVSGMVAGWGVGRGSVVEDDI
ncbi:ABC transporter permease [Halorientalis sp. IM1011]|uniref:ABC transporter permease n=1 Tax=Halorientalis sp. IM1011 TaxID=1932360 RepID=UPI00097CC580|nr:ABC transporter permease [Halorientalis sp. IM1011]AQL42253.1 ABC transporter permease [Halorientalis sp. IM1011]